MTNDTVSFSSPLVEPKNEKVKPSTARRCCTSTSKACACIGITLFLLIIGAVAGFLLWARMPNITFEGVVKTDNPMEGFKVQDLDFSFDFKLNFTIDNPNFVGGTLDNINSIVKLAIEEEPQIGTGEINDFLIERNSKTTLLFPIQINYSFAHDKNLKILKYIASKCGLIKPEDKSNINILYKVSSSIKVLMSKFQLPDHEDRLDIDCPIPPGIKIPGLDIVLAVLNTGILSNIDPKAIIQAGKDLNINWTTITPDQAQSLLQKLNPTFITDLFNPGNLPNLPVDPANLNPDQLKQIFDTVPEDKRQLLENFDPSQITNLLKNSPIAIPHLPQ